MNNEILESLLKLQNYILSEDFKGYDPYDSLMSPIFKLPILRDNKVIRFGFQQLFRRFPFNFRPLLGIKKGLNPVTLGLCIQAFTYLAKIFKENEAFYLNIINKCLEKLISLQSKGYSGSCWGYNFDWEARYARINAYVPTVVATGIITNGLFEFYKHYNDDKAKELILSSTKFVLNDLNRTYDKDGNFCFSYSPIDKQVVFNATMKGARLLSQAYHICKEKSLLDLAEKTVRFVVNHQKNDGSWSYSLGDARTWVDNFHTAYVLDCLDEYIKLSGNEFYRKNLDTGKEYYIKTFFYIDKIPKYYNNRLYPIDSTAVSQSILTLIRFEKIEIAQNILMWAIKNMQSKDGYFYYQLTKYYKHKTSYMRWSNAYSLLALSFFLFRKYVITEN
jgi:hypothetical protein